MASVSAELEASRADVLGLRRRLSESEGTVSRHLQDLAEVASRSRAFAERLAGAKNRAAVVAGEMSTGWRDCLEQEVMVMASVEVLESLLGDFKAAESRLGELEAQKKAEEEGRVERVTAVYEAKLVEQKAQLEGRLNERVMAYEKTMRDVEAKYAALLEAAESRHVAAAERCERLVAREAELVDEMEAKDVKILGLESDLVAVRMTAAETQVELESLNRRMVEREEAEGAEEGRNTRRSSASEMEEKARKYPELKAIAFDLKSRLRKRAELLESSMKENRRLRRIVHENERRAKGFLEELERLRRQIVEKKGAIKKLEAVARSLPVRHVGARPCDYDAPPETRKSPRRPRSVEWSCKDCGHEVAPDVLGRAEVDLGVGEEVVEGKEKEEGEECVGVAVGTAAEPGATLNTVVTSATQLHDVKASVPQEVRCVSGKLMSVPPCWKQQSMPGGVGGVSSLVTSIEVTIRELSKCLESQRQASVMAEDATYSLDADDGALTNTQDVNDTLSVTSDGGSLSVSASSLSRQSSYRCSERGVSSVAVGVAPRKKSLTPNPGAIGDLQEHISRCARELSSLCFALMQELTKPEAASGNVDAGSGVMVGAECGSSDHRRARAIISRTVKCVSALLEQKGGDEVLSCVVSDLREALRLLGPGRLNSPRQSHQGDSASNSCRSRSSGGATARKPTVTTSSSCSCQQRCSRVINTVEELTAMLNSTASVLSESAVQTRRQPHESGSP
uniref:DUF5741 domain-containing protein n=1 Tax=Mesocestoides corti TaxID=53468 RepID=A0A5K3G1V2_MESCO